MSGLFRAQGVVLRTVKLGEADRIITLCTRERGKVRAVAKGVRKTKSKFGARLEPISHVQVQCYEGRELHTVTQAETVNAFRTIREDLDRMRRALSMLEAVDNVVQEGEVNTRLYNMLVGALTSLEKHDSPLVLPAFFWKLLALEGVHPILDVCATCGEHADDLVAFDLNVGGVLCRACRQGVAISPEALHLLRRTLGGDLGRVLQEGPSPAAFELEHLADESLEIHLERRLRSRHVLHRV